MFPAPFCPSSGGTYVQHFEYLCAYYVGWQLVGLEWTLLNVSRHNTHTNIQNAVHKYLLMMGKKCSKHVEAINLNKLKANVAA
jgi:hypothetical protein